MQSDVVSKLLQVSWNVYTHITLTYDNDARAFAAYINGSPAGTWTYTAHALGNPSLRPARLGDNGRNDHTRDCEVKAMQIFTGTALSASEVSTLHDTYVAAGAV